MIMKILFFGTGRFAEIILEKLIRQLADKKLVEIVAVVTKIDQPADRHLNLKESLVKTLAHQNNLPILQPVNLKDLSFTKTVQDFGAFLLIATDYGKIIPQEILNLATLGAINVHPSLLPQYRGPSPIETAILNNDQKTGTSIMMIDPEIDHGPIIYQKEIPIEENDNTTSLEIKLAELSVPLLIKTIQDIQNSNLKTYEQDHRQATFSKIIKKEDGQINWSDDAQIINQQIKAYLAWPTSFSKYHTGSTCMVEKRLKIKEAKVITHQDEPGKLSIIEKSLIIGCGQNSLILERVLPEGGKEMTGYQWYLGHREVASLI
ncbi:methionyl-tRNA formyltransferase [Candidatus Azambacteria bacterium]|nr:methionyl-tRNA formyltransferase [Candidatus Azambacteria bacterium]